MIASGPVSVMEETATGRFCPSSSSGNVAVPDTVKVSPRMRSSAKSTTAMFVASYCLFRATPVTVSGFAVMSAVVAAVVLWL